MKKKEFKKKILKTIWSITIEHDELIKTSDSIERGKEKLVLQNNKLKYN